MLGETLAQRIDPNVDNIENSKPAGLTSHHAGANLNKTRQALLKKGSRRFRSSPAGFQGRHHHCPQQHPKHPGSLRSNPTRFTDINNNTVVAGSNPSAPTSTETVPNRTQTTVLTLHHLKQGAKKELLKSKTGRTEKVPQSGGQSVHSFGKHEHSAQNLNTRCQKNRHGNSLGLVPATKRSDNSCRPKPSAPLELYRRGGKKPLNLAGSVNVVNVRPADSPTEENLKDGEKTYAGAKFSEPPSPSVLPKPPSHWVGEGLPQHSDKSREQMTVHLKTLLKVQAKP
ncbi:proline-rich nuclear receptor coactivator 1 [Megalops cyprinoides]|uniref:proline-rich nuclear receptor coactivator 1 n=1 Tax=Megalops cyprinoides TaxID=118141 RepID=UPI001863F633|nr:proline-rich nuclear receptor coactivator 1 [Megalops cyprinoides]